MPASVGTTHHDQTDSDSRWSFPPKKLHALFTLANIPVSCHHELMNQYWPRCEAYAGIILNSPWYLVETPYGNIKIGYRKRVMSINWSGTKLRKVITEDDVTKDEEMVHAWSDLKAVEYLQTLSRELKRL